MASDLEKENLALMAAMGVKPLPPRNPGKPKPPVAGRPPGSGAAATRGAGPSRAPVPPAAVPAAPSPPAVPAPSPLQEARTAASRERDLRVEVEARLVEAQAARAQAEARARALQEERDALRFEVATKEGERVALARKVTELSARPPPRPARSLTELLLARGCGDEREAQAAFALLASKESVGLLPHLQADDANAVKAVLDERFTLVGEGLDWDDDDGVALRVPAARCEVSGGSDIELAWDELVATCIRLRYRVLCIVGGSPAYRKRLRILGERQPVPELLLVSGTQRRPRHRAEADLRAADAVVLWGATMLDHSVTASYEGGRARVIRIPHRGIGGMLSRLAREL